MKPRFSICIPVWEQHGFGLQYIKDLIYSIQIQTFQNYEIVISDHSINNDIYESLDLDTNFLNNDFKSQVKVILNNITLFLNDSKCSIK